jgi:hypothetical protein
VVEQYLNIGSLSLKEDGLNVRTNIASGSGRIVPEHGGISLMEKGLKVRTNIASGSGRTVPEHREPQPQGERSEGKNKHCFRQW